MYVSSAAVTFIEETFVVYIYIFMKIKVTRIHHNKMENTETWT